MSNDGSQQTLEAIFIQHRQQLRETAEAIVGTRHLAEDVIQSAYVKVLELSQESEVLKPAAYCFQIVRNLAIDYQRRRSLESQFFKDESLGLSITSLAGSPEHQLISRQRIMMVEKALSVLPERTRTAFMLYRLSGLTQREIAKRLGVSSTLVNFMIRDAVNILKSCRELFDQA